MSPCRPGPILRSSGRLCHALPSTPSGLVRGRAIIGCGPQEGVADAPPVRDRRRLRRPAVRRQPARSGARRDGPVDRPDAGDRQRVRLRRDDVRPPGARPGQHGPCPDLHAGRRGAVRRPSERRDGGGPGPGGAARWPCPRITAPVRRGGRARRRRAGGGGRRDRRRRVDRSGATVAARHHAGRTRGGLPEPDGGRHRNRPASAAGLLGRTAVPGRRAPDPGCPPPRNA